MSTSIVFVDTRVADYQTLIDGLEPGSEVYLIDEQSDGLEQMVASLNGRSGIDALHVISHGSQGSLYLGNTVLNNGNLSGYLSQLASIGGALTDTGDILLYGCNVAQGDVGVQFITSLAQATGADVAGSDDLTGSQASAGDWYLETKIGNVEASQIDVHPNLVPTLPAFVETHIVWNGNTYIVPVIPELTPTNAGSLFYVKDAAGSHLTNMEPYDVSVLAATSMALDFLQDIRVNRLDTKLVPLLEDVRGAIDTEINLRYVQGVAGAALDVTGTLGSLAVGFLKEAGKIIVKKVFPKVVEKSADISDLGTTLGSMTNTARVKYAEIAMLKEASAFLMNAKQSLESIVSALDSKQPLSAQTFDAQWIADNYYKGFLAIKSSLGGIEGVKNFLKETAGDSPILDILGDGSLALTNAFAGLIPYVGTLVGAGVNGYSTYLNIEEYNTTAKAIRNIDLALANAIDASGSIYNEEIRSQIENSILASRLENQIITKSPQSQFIQLSESASASDIHTEGTYKVQEFGVTITDSVKMNLKFGGFSQPVQGVVQIFKNDSLVENFNVISKDGLIEIKEFSGTGDYVVRFTQVGATALDYQVKLVLEPRVTEIKIIDNSDQDTIPGSIASTATIDPDSGSVRSAIEDATDQDWYKVILSSSKVYTIDIDGRTYGTDKPLEKQVIYIRDESGNIIQGATGSPNGWPAKFEFQPNSNGTYFISVEGQTSGYQSVNNKVIWLNGFGGYQVTVNSKVAPVEAIDDFGNDPANANVLNTASNPIAGTIQITGGIQKISDDDFFRVYLEANKTYLAAVYGKDSALGTLENPDIDCDVSVSTKYLYFNAHDEGQLFTPSQSGDYYFKVDSEDAGSRTGTYTLKVTAYDLTVDLLDNILTSGTVPTNGVPSAPSAINQVGDKDWFKATLNPQADVAGWSYGQYVTYDARVNEVDDGIHLQGRYFFDADGTALTVDGACRGSFTTSVPTSVYLQVNEYGDGIGSYTVELNPYLDDAGTDLNTSRMLNVSSSASMQYLTGVHETVGDEDWFKVWLNSGTNYKIDIISVPSGTSPDIHFSVLDIESYDGALSLDAGAIYVPSHSGYYILEVGAGMVTGAAYKIAAIDTTGIDDVVDISHARVLIPGTQLTGIFERTGDQDWVKATLTAGKKYTFSASVVEDEYLDDAIMQMVDTVGNPVTGIYNNVFGYDQLNIIPSATGTYYIKLFAALDNVTEAQPGIGSYEVNLIETNLTSWTQGQAKTAAYTKNTPNQNYGMTLVADHVYEVQVTSNAGAKFDVRDIRIDNALGESLTNSGDNSSSYYGSGTAYSTQQIIARTSGLHWVEIDPDALTSSSTTNVTMNVVDLGLQDDFTDSRTSSVEFFQSQAVRSISGIIGYNSSDLSDSDNWYFDAEAGCTYQFSLRDSSSSLPIDASQADFRVKNATRSVSLMPDANGQVTFTASSDGRWYVNVYDVDNLAETNYTLIGQQLVTTAVEDDYSSDALTTGRLTPMLGSQSSVAATFETASDADWYRVDLEPSQKYFFSTSAGTLTLLNSTYYFHDQYAHDPIIWNNFDAVKMTPKDDGVQLIAYAPVTIYAEVKNSGVAADVGRDYEITVRTKGGQDQVPIVRMPSLAVAVEDATDISLSLIDVVDTDGDSVEVTIQSLPGYATIKLGNAVLTEGSVVSGTDLSELTFTPEAKFAGNAGALVLNTNDGWGNCAVHTVNISVFPNQIIGAPAVTQLDYSASTTSISVDLTQHSLAEGRNGTRQLAENIEEFVGSAYADEILGSAQGDVLSGGDGGDYLDGRDGYDELSGGTGNDTLTGGADGDYLSGGDGDDLVFGGNGVDVIIGGTGKGDDYYDGGMDFDIVSYESAVNEITVDLATGIATGIDINSDSLVGIEGVMGGSGSDSIFGSDGAEYLYGDAGDDTLSGRGGDDSMNGGAGVDTVVFGGVRSLYVLTATPTGWTIVGPDGNDVLTKIEYAEFSDQTIPLGDHKLLVPSTDFNTDNVSDILWRNITTGQNVLWHSASAGQSLGITAVGDPAHWKILSTADFNGDKTADILWRNTSTGANAIWSGGTSAQTQPVVSVGDTNYKIVGVGDFNGDKSADILWRNSSTGANIIWCSANALTPQPIVGVNDTRWIVAGIGDFNGDTVSDVLWRNTSTGANVIWQSGDTMHAQAVSTVGDTHWQVAGIGDFNGDTTSDILWRNTSTGANAIWKGGKSDQGQPIDSISDLSWTVAGTADYNGDGTSDILWRNTNTGDNVIWKSANSRTTQPVSAVGDTAWQIQSQTNTWTQTETSAPTLAVSAFDLNGDHKSDLIWRNTSTGKNAIWSSADASVGLSIFDVSDTTWKIAAIADFDADKNADILWRNASSGANIIWKSGNGMTPQAVSSVGDTQWKIAGVGDFDGDTKADILWRNTNTGANAIWKSAVADTGQPVDSVGDQNWKVAGIGDFDGDNKDDILWRNTATGTNAIWKNANGMAGQAVETVATAWLVAGIGDFNGDNKDDILWRNTTTGANAIWNAGNAANGLAIDPVGDLNYRVAGTGDYNADGKDDVMWRNATTGSSVIWNAGHSAEPIPLVGVADANWTNPVQTNTWVDSAGVYGV
ncbi:DUF4347 domain-containing protein [Candidatus Symbiobacter mobilis]|uniref:Calcium-binding RTX toxin-like protein n=1 Tax=Candidatus Symbiobacter mobilis CR TaxID=946483 RepID=U5NAP1_9BURK|nr:DUF4347 domain-containing protein [Candidatus Symbiobacter mobilis]AGX88355.1 calcium-binding RTX toxin-like protein [Candidatus Symbiobacter mobilis CR]